jgi:hypothetical protein
MIRKYCPRGILNKINSRPPQSCETIPSNFYVLYILVNSLNKIAIHITLGAGDKTAFIIIRACFFILSHSRIKYLHSKLGHLI